MLMSERAGFYRTNLSGVAAYRSYVPHPLPPDPPLVLDDEGNKLLVQAHRHLARLDALGSHVPDIDQFIAMFVRKEALISSQIEGTQATLEDLLDPLIKENIDHPVADVVHFIQAFNYATDRLKTLPLCNRLLRETHRELLSGANDKEKTPGDFRRSQNWIGGRGSTLRTARFIPPNPEDMQ